MSSKRRCSFDERLGLQGPCALVSSRRRWPRGCFRELRATCRRCRRYQDSCRGLQRRRRWGWAGRRVCCVRVSSCLVHQIKPTSRRPSIHQSMLRRKKNVSDLLYRSSFSLSSMILSHCFLPLLPSGAVRSSRTT